MLLLYFLSKIILIFQLQVDLHKANTKGHRHLEVFCYPNIIYPKLRPNLSLKIQNKADIHAIMIAGPTGVGKTTISKLLQERIHKHSEIISVDSGQVYKYMDIGTAKFLTISKSGNISKTYHPILMTNLLSPDEGYYNSFLYMEHFHNCVLTQLRNKHRDQFLPILVGGSNLYFRSIIYNKTHKRITTNQFVRDKEEVREALKPLINDSSLLYHKLTELDPNYSKSIHKNDSKRVIRALVINLGTNRTLGNFTHAGYGKYQNCNSSISGPKIKYSGWFMYRNKDTLKELILKRTDYMIRNGLVGEVIRLIYKHGLLENPVASSILGYRQTIHFLKNLGFLGKVSYINKPTQNKNILDFKWFPLLTKLLTKKKNQENINSTMNCEQLYYLRNTQILEDSLNIFYSTPTIPSNKNSQTLKLLKPIFKLLKELYVQGVYLSPNLKGIPLESENSKISNIRSFFQRIFAIFNTNAQGSNLPKLHDLSEAIVRDTLEYAKKQHTAFKKNKMFTQINLDSLGEEAAINKILNEIHSLDL